MEQHVAPDAPNPYQTADDRDDSPQEIGPEDLAPNTQNQM